MLKESSQVLVIFKMDYTIHDSGIT